MDGGNEGYPLLRSQTTVDLSRNGEAVADLTGKVHLLPCCIKYDGSTSVSDYFKPKFSGIEVDGLRVEEAYFRGRKLNGATLPLPDGYSGYYQIKWREKGLDQAEKVKEKMVNNAKGRGNLVIWVIICCMGNQGFILGKKSSDEKTNAETSYCWEANAKFQNLTLWNHDSLPSNDDAFMRTFHWFDVAKALHQPVNVEDLEYLPVDEDVV